MIRKTLMSIAALGSVAMLAAPVSAQSWPNKAIKVIVDGPAGGINDIWTRRYAQRLTEQFGQPVVVEPRPGASGTIAAEAVGKSAPDGYTVLFGGMNPLVAFPGAGGTVRYDPTKDFVPSAIGAMGYPLFVASSALGVKSVAELVAKAKASGSDMTCGTSGQASVQQFACANVAKALGIKLRAIPYKGGAAALLDAAAGQIDVSVGYTAETEALVTQGRLIPLASFAPNRLPRFPNAPSFAEAGYPGLELPSFSGFFFPAGTPQAMVDRFNTEAVKAMAKPEMAEFVKAAGGFYIPFKSAEFADFVRKEQAKWKKMSDETGIRAEQ
jgi:tripartite-type tricarboxylate transporter receptor subunit TctC